MKTRNPEHFEITFVHKQNIQNSPIVYMQKLFNQEKKILVKVT